MFPYELQIRDTTDTNIELFHCELENKDTTDTIKDFPYELRIKENTYEVWTS